ncbi:hypothetical protein FOA52_015058 [Chlamydomonas sp. UWO 241]|nr:hypothetical protein FOA52_015058 [Chlamydomonas sp. UWO 241]
MDHYNPVFQYYDTGDTGVVQVWIGLTDADTPGWWYWAQTQVTPDTEGVWNLWSPEATKSIPGADGSDKRCVAADINVPAFISSGVSTKGAFIDLNCDSLHWVLCRSGATIAAPPPSPAPPPPSPLPPSPYPAPPPLPPGVYPPTPYPPSSPSPPSPYPPSPAPPPSPSPPPPAVASTYTATINDNTYKLFFVGLPFWDAETHCLSVGGHLASYPTQTEYDTFTTAVASQFPDDGAGTFGPVMWIGLVQSVPGVWRWIDDAKVTWAGFGAIDWYTHDVSNKSCAATFFERAREWVNIDCAEAWPFACRVDATPASPPPAIPPTYGLSAPPPPAPPADASEPVYSYEFAAGSYRYQLNLAELTYAEAERDCAAAFSGGKLASFPSTWDLTTVSTKINDYLATTPFSLPFPPPAPPNPPLPPPFPDMPAAPPRGALPTTSGGPPIWIGYAYVDPSGWVSTWGSGAIYWADDVYVGGNPSRACGSADPASGYVWVPRFCFEAHAFLCMTTVEEPPASSPPPTAPPSPLAASTVSLDTYRYDLHATAVSWPVANASCVAAGGFLASFHSAAEHSAVMSGGVQYALGVHGTAWIGLRTGVSGVYGPYVWSDGGRTMWTHWDSSWVSNVGSPCALTHADWGGAWSTSDCLDKRPYVCKTLLTEGPNAPSSPPPGTAVSPPPPGGLYTTVTGFSDATDSYSWDGTNEFMIFTAEKGWEVAADECLRNGGELAHFNSLEEWSAVTAAFSAFMLVNHHAAFWIGLQDWLGPNNFTWSNDPDTQPNFTAWNPPGCPDTAGIQPDNFGGNQACVAADFKPCVRWNDNDCARELPSLCRFAPAPPPPPPPPSPPRVLPFSPLPPEEQAFNNQLANVKTVTIDVSTTPSTANNRIATTVPVLVYTAVPNAVAVADFVVDPVFLPLTELKMRQFARVFTNYYAFNIPRFVCRINAYTTYEYTQVVDPPPPPPSPPSPPPSPLPPPQPPSPSPPSPDSSSGRRRSLLDLGSSVFSDLYAATDGLTDAVFSALGRDSGARDSASSSNEGLSADVSATADAARASQHARHAAAAATASQGPDARARVSRVSLDGSRHRLGMLDIHTLDPSTLLHTPGDGVDVSTTEGAWLGAAAGWPDEYHPAASTTQPDEYHPAANSVAHEAERDAALMRMATARATGNWVDLTADQIACHLAHGHPNVHGLSEPGGLLFPGDTSYGADGTTAEFPQWEHGDLLLERYRDQYLATLTPEKGSNAVHADAGTVAANVDAVRRGLMQAPSGGGSAKLLGGLGNNYTVLAQLSNATLLTNGTVVVPRTALRLNIYFENADYALLVSTLGSTGMVQALIDNGWPAARASLRSVNTSMYKVYTGRMNTTDIVPPELFE